MILRCLVFVFLLHLFKGTHMFHQMVQLCRWFKDIQSLGRRILGCVALYKVMTLYNPDDVIPTCTINSLANV